MAEPEAEALAAESEAEVGAADEANVLAAEAEAEVGAAGEVPPAEAPAEAVAEAEAAAAEAAEPLAPAAAAAAVSASDAELPTSAAPAPAPAAPPSRPPAVASPYGTHMPRPRPRAVGGRKEKVAAPPSVVRAASRRLIPSVTATWRREAPPGGESALLAAAASNAADGQLSAAVSEEQQAREHLRRVRARVQRELARASSMAALEDARERKRQAGAEIRADFDRAIGRDLTMRIAEDLSSGRVAAASEEEVRRMSELFNQRLVTAHPETNSFFTLFKAMDVDGSRRVSFKEFSLLLRDELKISKRVMPVERLQALWMKLDENSSGYVDAGELGRFMKLGRLEAGLGARARVVMARKAGRDRQRLELDKQSGVALTQMLQRDDVPAAPEEELQRLSTLFNAQMEKLRPRDASGTGGFYKLFKHMDADGSGRISFKELTRMVRDELQLGKEEMPLAKMHGLWRALDENESGFICSGEFGRFMRLRATEKSGGVDPHVQDQAKKREERAMEMRRSDEQWKLRAAAKAKATATALADEAGKLEAALKAAGRSPAGAQTPTLPPISPNGGRLTSTTSMGVLETNAALQKLARETLALSQGGRQ